MNTEIKNLITLKEIVFATKSNILIPVSLQADGVNLCYFKQSLFDQSYMHKLKLGCKDIGNRKSVFAARTQLFKNKKPRSTGNQQYKESKKYQ